MIELVHGDADIIRQVEGKVTRTTYCIAAIEDGKVLGIAGYYPRDDHLVAWVRVTPELKQRPRLIVQGARMLLAMMARRRMPIVAGRDVDEPSAKRFLTHFGFTPYKGDTWVRWPR